MLTWHQRGLPSRCSCRDWSQLAGLLRQRVKLRSHLLPHQLKEPVEWQRCHTGRRGERRRRDLEGDRGRRDLRGDRRRRNPRGDRRLCDLRGDHGCTLSRHSGGRDLRGDYSCIHEHCYVKTVKTNVKTV